MFLLAVASDVIVAFPILALYTVYSYYYATHPFHYLVEASTAAAAPPQSCWYSFYLSTASFGMILLIFSEYVRLRDCTSLVSTNMGSAAAAKFAHTNKMMLRLGVWVAFSIMIVSSFQYNHVLWMHMVGATGVFFPVVFFMKKQIQLGALVDELLGAQETRADLWRRRIPHIYLGIAAFALGGNVLPRHIQNLYSAWCEISLIMLILIFVKLMTKQALWRNVSLKSCVHSE